MPLGAKTVLQQPQRGTGHAMLVARRALAGAKHALVLPGDAPLVRTGNASRLDSRAPRRRWRGHDTERRARQSHRLRPRDSPDRRERCQRSWSKSKLAENQREINEVNSSIYCFSLEKLWPAMARLKPENAHRELYLTDAIGLLAQGNQTVLARNCAGCQRNSRLQHARGARRSGSRISQARGRKVDGRGRQHPVSRDSGD